ncbi:MAG: hypothetical protein O2807_10160 [bacterium]|nr:hypothetical protein [bacterium]
MDTGKNPSGDFPGGQDLESRWEDALHGRSSSEEASALQGEIDRSGRRAEFLDQAQISAAVRDEATRHKAPEELRSRLLELPMRDNRPAWIGGRVWWAAAGALAASVVFLIGLSISQKPQTPESEIFSALGREARAEYQRVRLDPRPVQTGSKVLGKILGWFEPRVNFRPKVFFGGGDETTLEGGRVGYVAGTKVPGFLYRWKGETLVLVIFPAGENPAWSKLPRKKWVTLTDEGPTTGVWRRGDFIYALVGQMPPETMREIAKSITPPSMKF